MLIVAGIGVTSGALSPSIYTTVIIMVAHLLRSLINMNTFYYFSFLSNPKHINYYIKSIYSQSLNNLHEQRKKWMMGDYKFLLKLDDKYQFLVKDKNEEKTDGLLVIEVVPKDQDIQNIVLPESGDKVHVWGAWVTDKPKGWHEIHPTWQITKE